MKLEELCEEIEEEEDEVFVDMKNNQYPESSDDNIQYHVRILLARDKGYNSTDQYSSSISLVPSILRDHIQESFTPRVVSIGPVHHEDENLKRSEGWKKTCMCDLLERSGSPEQMLVACLRKVKESVRKIRKCYVVKRHYSNYELARMIVMDGCFILEVLFRVKKVNYFLWVQVRRDLLLVENQIPLFVLTDIFRCTILKYEPNASLTELVEPLLEFGHGCLFGRPFETFGVWAHATDEDHFLSLLHKCYKPNLKLSSKQCSFTCNVVELEKAGVKFKPDKDASWPLAITIERSSRFAIWFSRFWDKPTVRIPVMMIQDETEMIIRNIIAYEQTSRVVNYFSTYVSLIDDLIDTGHDVAKLVESKIIIFNGLGSNEEVAKMINSLGKNTIVANFYHEQWKVLGDYYNSYWPNHIARWKTTYINNPWKFIALIVAIILFGLTAVQTYFTICPRNATVMQ